MIVLPGDIARFAPASRWYTSCGAPLLSFPSVPFDICTLKQGESPVNTAAPIKLNRLAWWMVLGCTAGVAPASALAQQSFAGAPSMSSATSGASVDGGLTVAPTSQDIPGPLSERSAVISVSRAADLVGRPLDLISHSSGQVGTQSLPSGTPLANAVVTSGFGNRRHPILGNWRHHAGIDLASPHGSEIRATADGVVSKAAQNGGYGLYVALTHSGDIETSYGHMSRLNVSAGQRVRRGQVIGYVGSTGLATGPHLHYEVRVNGKPVNPERMRP